MHIRSIFTAGKTLAAAERINFSFLGSKAHSGCGAQLISAKAVSVCLAAPVDLTVEHVCHGALSSALVESISLMCRGRHLART